MPGAGIIFRRPVPLYVSVADHQPTQPSFVNRAFDLSRGGQTARLKDHAEFYAVAVAGFDQRVGFLKSGLYWLFDQHVFTDTCGGDTMFRVQSAWRADVNNPQPRMIQKAIVITGAHGEEARARN